MKIFLICLLILSYSGGILSVVLWGIEDSQIPWKGLFILFVAISINLLSAKYLYQKASDHKTEWALAAAMGNVNVIFFYWFYQMINNHCKERKSIFKNIG